MISGRVIELEQVSREFVRGGTTVRALDGVSLAINSGSFVSIMGKSGSGKSTLLHLISGLMAPTAGTIRVLGKELKGLSDDQLTLLRRKQVGFVFQFFNLLPTLTALENVALQALLAGAKPAQATARAREMLALVGLAERGEHRPDELSGGQMQRVALARALVNEPPLLLADEPTGNLDTASGSEILALLKELQTRGGQTIVMVTHDQRAAAHGGRIITMEDGRVLSERQTGDAAV